MGACLLRPRLVEALMPSAHTRGSADAERTQRGTKAPQAAGVIHGDFERGFICAETMKFDDFKELGSEAAVKVPTAAPAPREASSLALPRRPPASTGRRARCTCARTATFSFSSST